MNIILTTSLTSHAITLIGFLALLLMLALSWKARIYRTLLITACFASLIWAGKIITSILLQDTNLALNSFFELFKSASWLYFLYVVLQSHDETTGDGTDKPKVTNNEKLFFIAIFVAIFAFLKTENSQLTTLNEEQFNSIALSIWIILSICGLVLIEQVYRHARPEGRWAIKHLCLGLGGCFVYDIFYFSDALLFNAINPNLWAARGAVNAIAVSYTHLTLPTNREV